MEKPNNIKGEIKTVFLKCKEYLKGHDIEMRFDELNNDGEDYVVFKFKTPFMYDFDESRNVYVPFKFIETQGIEVSISDAYGLFKKTKVKTLQAWEESELEWDDFFKPGDRIDEEVFLHISEEVGESYSSFNLIQCAEPVDSKNGIETHVTALKTNDGRYYYLGVLPDFNMEV